VRIGLLGGLRVHHDGRNIAVTGAMQQSVLFRLAVEAGTSVSYRAISEDIWGMDAPENTKAALQSIVSRLRSQLPPDAIESTAGGYRLAISREDVDALVFSDFVAAAAAATEPAVAAREASTALAVWGGEPWVPSDNFDWFERDMLRDRELAISLGGAVARPTSRSELPAQLTSLVGREAELATLRDQLAANRLVTIIGTGGAGKTRLALEAASHERNSVLVELAPVGPSEVLGAVLTATGREIRTTEGSDLSGSRDRIVDALIGREILLVLDNCEHVIDAAAALADDLLSALPQLRILATSREPLGVPGEAFVGVGSLPHPTDANIAELTAAELRNFAAIELFGQRAMSARGTPLADDEITTAAKICARLDGLPLAMELAAARLRTMGVDEVLAGLDDRFTLLSGGYRTARPRHQTLRAMIDWSWSLLDDEQRRALAWFAVFPAGVGAVEARALAKELKLQSASVFDALVDRSLLQRTRGRFRALETIREYGIERLAERGELVDARTTQARYMMKRAQEFDRLLRGPRIMQAIGWFDDEEDNIASALRYTTGVPLADIAVGLAVACAWYWIIRDRSEDASTWLKAVSTLASSVDTDEARVLALLAPIMEGFDETDDEPPDMENMSGPLAALLESLRKVELRAGSHELLQLIAPAAEAFGAVIGHEDWMSEVNIPDPKSLGLDPWPTAVLLIASAAMAQNRGNIAELGRQSREALDLFTELGDTWGLALSEQMYSLWLAAEGRFQDALEMGDSSTEHMREITSSWDLAQQRGLAIQMLLRLGRIDEVTKRVEVMLADAEAGGNARTIVQAQLTAIAVDVEFGDIASAGTRIAVVEALQDTPHRGPGQFTALIESAKAAIATKRGDLDQTEQHLRTAAEAAIRSHDQPIIGMVALHVGSYALARGDVALAVRAADVATALTGAYDATHPEMKRIVEAADKAAIGRPSTTVPGRPISIQSLNELLVS
jgi:predicted ATPase